MLFVENALASAQKHESTDDALEEFSLNILQDLLGTGLQESFQAIASNGRAENSSIQGDNQKGALLILQKHFTINPI